MRQKRHTPFEIEEAKIKFLEIMRTVPEAICQWKRDLQWKELKVEYEILNPGTGMGKAKTKQVLGSEAPSYVRFMAEKQNISSESVSKGIARANRSSEKTWDAYKNGLLKPSTVDAIIQLDVNDQDEILPKILTLKKYVEQKAFIETFKNNRLGR